MANGGLLALHWDESGLPTGGSIKLSQQ